MNLLVRLASELRRLTSRGVAFTVLVFAILATVEIVGRNSATDLHDLLALFTLALLGLLISARHRQSPLPWATAIGELFSRLGIFLKQGAFQIGLDLRGTPKVKQGTPPAVKIVAFGLMVLLLLTAGLSPWMPLGFRSTMAPFAYLLYLPLLAGLWASLAGMSVLAAFYPWALIHDAFVTSYEGPRPRMRRPEVVGWALYFSALLLASAFLPLWMAPALLVGVTSLYLIANSLTRRSEAQFLWRPTGSVKVRALPWAHWVRTEFGIIGLVMLNLTLATCGRRLWVRFDLNDLMPVTTFLGITLAWLAPGAMTAILFQMLHGRWRDPARGRGHVAHITGSKSHAQRSELRSMFRKHGWMVRYSAKPQPLDVPIILADQPLPTDDYTTTWPLTIRPADLDSEAIMFRLKRRDEIQKRRRFLAGLERLLKLGKQRDRAGTGWWIAPQFWFLMGLMRDKGRDQDDDAFSFHEDPLLSLSVGPPYHRVWPRAVRGHLYDILRAAQIDLIYVEDGVSFKRLKAVLRVIFEVYDIHGGKKPVEDVHFLGQPGTKVMIHDYQFDEPFKAESYPEPQYDHLGRARILHIFRDRGGHEEFVELPGDFSRRPAPAGAR